VEEENQSYQKRIRKYEDSRCTDGNKKEISNLDYLGLGDKVNEYNETRYCCQYCFSWQINNKVSTISQDTNKETTTERDNKIQLAPLCISWIKSQP